MVGFGVFIINFNCFQCVRQAIASIAASDPSISSEVVFCFTLTFG
jgi:hypothetical protein